MKKFDLLVFVDDDHPTNVYHKIILEDSGLCDSSKFFTSPIDALSFFQDLCNSENAVFPSILFVDINMPAMDGWEFIEKLEKLNFPSFPPVIMLTTSQYRKDVDKGNSIESVRKVMVKPLEVEHLQSLNRELLNEE